MYKPQSAQPENNIACKASYVCLSSSLSVEFLCRKTPEYTPLATRKHTIRTFALALGLNLITCLVEEYGEIVVLGVST